MKASYRAIIGSALFVLMSCARPESHQAAAPTVITSARMILNDDAAMIVTNARCAREAACHNVGASRPYTDRDACRREVFPGVLASLRGEACPTGVDEGKLEVCLSDVRQERCDAPRAVSDEPTSCRRTELCLTP